MKISNFYQYLFALICVPMFVGIIHGQVFTEKFRGYLNEEQVIFTLTFNRESGKIDGNYVSLKTGTKKLLSGLFYKQPKKDPKIPPKPPNPYQTPIDTTNYFNLYEVDAKTKKKVRRATLVLDEEMHGNWAMRNVRGLIDLDLVREFEGKLETYRISEKTILEVTPKYEIAIVQPILTGENLSGIRSFNEFIEKKLQAAILQFKQSALKLKIEDIYSGTNLKWDIKGNFHTKYANDRFITLLVTMGDNVLDENSNLVTKTADFIVNFDLRNQKEISFDDIFEADSEHLKAFSQVCKDKFRNAGFNPRNYRQEPISLQFCEPEAKNFDNLLIKEDGLYFYLKPDNKISEIIPAPQMKLSFETIQRLGGKFKKNGAIYDLAYSKKQ